MWLVVLLASVILTNEAAGLGKYKHLSANDINTSDGDRDLANSEIWSSGGGDQSIETLAAALLLGMFAFFIVVYAICLQCCWHNSRCPYGLNKDSDVEVAASLCPCVEAMNSPDVVEAPS